MGEKGLHNILEPAVYGIPIIIGDNYKKFPEATDLIERGDCFSVSNKYEFIEVVKKLSIKSNYIKVNPREYIVKNLGATDKIFNELELFLDD
jgi:3-deoxy-D-manno-octulosonic-acid transferase